MRSAQKLTEEQEQQIAKLALKWVHLKTPDAASNKNRLRTFEEGGSTPQKNLCSSFMSVTRSGDCGNTISSKASSLRIQPGI